MNNNQVLYLSYDGMTDPLGQSQVLPYIVGLSKKEINFTIISFEKKIAFKTQEKIIKKITSTNNIKWKPLNYTKRPPFISTIYDIYKLRKIVRKEIEKEKIALIHCRSYITALIGLWAKRKYNIPFVFDMRGFWADERIDGKIWNINNKLHKMAYDYFKKREKEFLQEAAYTISLTECGKKEIQSWELDAQSLIKVIPCCTDEELFNIDNVNNVRAELGILSDDFVISYVGSLGTWYMLDEMLDFFKISNSKNKKIKFLFITKDNPQKIINTSIKKEIDIKNIIITSATRKMMPSYIYASNCSIFFIKPFYSKKASSPTKMGEIMLMEIPIICNTGIGDVDLIMSKSIPEYLVHEFSTKEYDRISDLILKSNIQTDKIKSVAKQYFSLKEGIDSYYKIYQQLL